MITVLPSISYLVSDDFYFLSFPSSQNHLNLVLVNNVPLFFNVRDGPYMPTLRLLHQCEVFSFINSQLCLIYLISSICRYLLFNLTDLRFMLQRDAFSQIS